MANPPQITITTSFTRPADTATYAINDCISDSTSAPTSGGFTFSNFSRESAGSGIITDLLVTSSNNAATPLLGELWIFETSVTNDNDNAAFALTDGEIQTLVAVIPFALVQGLNNSHCHVQNLSILGTCVGSANLRYKVKAKNAYIPANAEVFTFRLKVMQPT